MTTPPPASDNYGKAMYVVGRGKNKVLTYVSRKNKTLVYEFMVSSKFKTPGLVSWKCVSCAKIKNDYRAWNEKLNKKIPLILVDNDIIKEDPERPLNAEHFCTGKDIIESVVNRAKLEFLARDDKMDGVTLQQEVLQFSKTLGTQESMPLNPKEKKMVQRFIVGNVPTLYESVQKRRDLKRGNRKESDYVLPGKKQNFHGTLVFPVSRAQEPTPQYVDVCYEERVQEAGPSSRQYYSSEPSSSREPVEIHEEVEYEEIIVEEVVEVSDTTCSTPPPPLSPQQNVHGDMVFGNMQHVAYDIELG